MNYKSLVLALCLLLIGSVAYSQTVDDIIAKNIKARGGEEAYTKVTNVKAQMKMSMMGMEVPMLVYVKENKFTRVEMDMMGQKMISVVTPTSGWMSQGGQVMDIPQEQLALAQAQVSSQNPVNNPLINYKKDGAKVTLEGKEKVDGKDVFKIKYEKKDSPAIIMYIDCESYIDVKTTVKMNMNGEEMEMDAVMKDNKVVDGILVPHTIDLTMGGEPAGSVVFEKIEFNVKLDNTLFDKPKQ